METIISTCGWVLFGTIALAILAFAAACIWGATFLGYHLATRFIRERRHWKKVIRAGNHQIVQYAAIIMRDRLGYGETATLQEIIKDTANKINNKTK